MPETVELVPRTSDEVRAMIDAMSPEIASQRVLQTCGFTHVGDEMDPEDGLVWRFEKHR